MSVAVHAGSSRQSFVGSIVAQLAKAVVHDLFGFFDGWVTGGTRWVLMETWSLLGRASDPVISGSSFRAELGVMGEIAAGTVLPLLLAGVIQAVVRQDGAGLLRTLIVRLPMAILFTGIAVELVSLGLQWTDEASQSLLGTGSSPAQHWYLALVSDVTGGAIGPGVSFGGILVLLLCCLVALLLWVELAFRSAGVAVATLFLPLCLAGLVWPATSHWARRLGETLAALVLMKLVMAAILALASGSLTDPAGVSGVVEGIALLLLAALSPWALFKLIPVLEGGVTSMEGASQSAHRAAAGARQYVSDLADRHGNKSGSGEASGKSGATGREGPAPGAGSGGSANSGPGGGGSGPGGSGGGGGGQGGSANPAGTYVSPEAMQSDLMNRKRTDATIPAPGWGGAASGSAAEGVPAGAGSAATAVAEAGLAATAATAATAGAAGAAAATVGSAGGGIP
jgi:hypothetical protein